MELAQRTIKDMAAQMTALVNTIAEGKQPASTNMTTVKEEEKENNGRRPAPAWAPTKKLPMHPKGRPQLCKNCNKTVRHFEKDCMELEANAHLCGPGWKSNKK